MNAWFIIAQVMGLITIILEFASYQIKNQRKYFLFAGVSSLFWTLMFISMAMYASLATQMSLIVASSYSTIRALVFWWIFKEYTPKRKRAGRIFLAFMIVVALVAGTMSVVNTPVEVRWLHAIGFAAALGFVVGQYLPGKHYVRIAVVIYASVVLLTQTPINIPEYDFVTGEHIENRWNFMGMAIELSKIISVIVFYVILTRRSRQIKALKKIKQTLAYEVHKVKRGATVGEIANILPTEKLEKLVAKMVRYEIATTDLGAVRDIESSMKCTQTVMADMKTAQDVKDMIARVIELKKIRLDAAPIPKFSSRKDDMKDAMFGDMLNKKEEEAK